MSVPKRKQLSKATRLEVLNKYDNHCAYCGCELTYEQLNVDHKIPLYYAGQLYAFLPQLQQI